MWLLIRLNLHSLSYNLLSICSIFEFFPWFIYFICWLIIYSHLFYFSGCFRIFPGGIAGKESACNTGYLSWILGWEDRLKKGTATHSSILAWRIPWTIQSWRVRRDWAVLTFTFQDVSYKYLSYRSVSSGDITPHPMQYKNLTIMCFHLHPSPLHYCCHTFPSYVL